VTVERLFWPNVSGRDIHLLRGTVSPRLDHLLRIADTRGTRRADDPHPGVTVTFEPKFKGAPDAHGVTVDTDTGEVSVAAALPAGPRLRSFIMVCTASEDDEEFTTRIRFFIHEAISEKWLTPDRLTVRNGASNMRFSVLATFNDGVIGDVSNWSPFRTPDPDDRTYVREQDSTDPIHVWSATGTGITVDPNTGVLICTSDTANATVGVRRPPNPLSTATAVGAPGWNTPVRLTKLSKLGFERMADGDVHNILFLPDGFADTAADHDDFKRYARVLVARLNLRQRTRPFDLFRERFNYFLAWVPSRQPGVSALDELNPVVQAEGTFGFPLTLPVPPTGSPVVLTLTELIDTVGLPTPAVDHDGDPLGTDAAGRPHDWQELYGPLPTAARVATAYPNWLRRNDRVLLNERDTAFHIAFSDRPRIDGRHTARELEFHPMRVDDDDFDIFLDALRDDAGHGIPSVWARGGKDDTLIVFLCRSRRNGGTNVARRNGGRYLCLSLFDDDAHVLTAATGNGFDLVPDAVPAEVPTDTWTTVAHELAHSFTLGDEYGGRGLIPEPKADKLAEVTNLQPRSELLNDDDVLDLTDLKWDWPRLEKAGVLIERPDDQSGSGDGPFLLTLRPGHGKPFAVGDIIRLRTRPLLEANPPSGRLRVSVKSGDTLTAELLTGSTLDPDDFDPATMPDDPKWETTPIVMVPRIGPPPVDTGLGNDLGLVATSVMAHLSATHNPLNAAPDDLPDRPCAGELDVPTPSTNFPGGVVPHPPKFSSWVVGLYENGGEYDCGVYRPTGICIMSEGHFVDPDTGTERAYQFCTVCRYAMVDLIDPSRHGVIDLDYAPRYPP
jgi:hypothetical protein